MVLTVTDWRGCIAQQNFEAVIPIYEMVMTMQDCQTRIYNFEAIVDGEDLFIGTYLWDFGDGQTGAGQTQTHQYSTPGTYTVTLAQSIPGCIITQTRQLAVHGPPAIAIFPTDPRFCEGSSLVLTAIGADNYLWNNGQQEPEITVYTPSSYSVRGFSVFGCYADKTVYVEYFPYYNYRIQSDKKEINRHNATVNFWTEDIFNSYYTWIFDGEEDIEHFFNTRHIYTVTEDRMYKVKLSVINPHGCLEEDEMDIHANVIQVNTFTPNGDGVNDVFMKGWKIEIYNRNGQLFYKGSDGWDGTYNGGKPAAKDTYFYLLYDQTESSVVKYQGYITLLR